MVRELPVENRPLARVRDGVAILPAPGTKPCVKVSVDGRGFGNADILGQLRVDRSGQHRNRQKRFGPKADDLAESMNSGVSPTGAANPSKHAGDTFNCFLNCLLDGSTSDLDLESAEIGPIINQGQADGLHSRSVRPIGPSVDQLDQRHLGCIAKALTEADDARITAWAIDKARTKHVKELLDDLRVKKLC